MTEVVTFGCRLNLSESAEIARLAREAGLADAVVVNTCAVTGEAERQARQAIRRLKRERPGARIVVTGCAAQLAPGRFAAMPEVSHVVGNREKLARETWARLGDRSLPRAAVADIMRPAEAPAAGLAERGDRTRAFLAIQHGCDHRCTFCVIPFARGPSRSLPVDTIVARTRRLVADGAGEVVLTGVDLSHWGSDLYGRPALGRALRAVLTAVPEVPRLRLSSLDPAELDDELWDLLAHAPRLMPHLHLSLQSGDDLILKRMKRRHGRAQALECIARARALRPGLAVGADLIAGFPTETAAMFESTRALVAAGPIDFVHVFAYSPRPGTPAARMPAVPGDAVRARAAILRADADAALARFLRRQIGGAARVLVERSGLAGHAENFARVAFDRPAPRGAIVTADLTGVGVGALLGRIADGA